MQKIRLREAEEKDIKFLFDLSNDELVRKNSFNSNKIEWEEHKKWFQAQRKSKNVIIYVLEIDGKLVGQARIKYDNRIGRVSYSICKGYRGKGYGKLIIKLLEKRCTDKIDILIAQVKKNNIASISVFKKNGYLESNNCNEEFYEYYKRLYDKNMKDWKNYV